MTLPTVAAIAPVSASVDQRIVWLQAADVQLVRRLDDVREELSRLILSRATSQLPKGPSA